MEWLEKARAEHEAKLVVGQRVRVDLGECPHVGRWHGTIEQGETGRIMGLDIDVPQKPEGHRYWVFFDWPVRMRRSWSYSAHELIPIPDPTPEEIRDETLKRLTVRTTFSGRVEDEDSDRRSVPYRWHD